MSHDRGCPCGREKGQYNECPDPACIRRETKNRCEGDHSMKVNRGINLNEEKRYVRVLADGTAHILTLQELKNVPESVTLYELGPEVKVVTKVEVVPTKPVYR